MSSGPRVRITIEPDLCGPVSVGTGAVVRLLSAELALPLGEALSLVDRAVYERHTLELAAPSLETARRLVASLSALRSPARVRAELLAD